MLKSLKLVKTRLANFNRLLFIKDCCSQSKDVLVFLFWNFLQGYFTVQLSRNFVLFLPHPRQLIYSSRTVRFCQELFYFFGAVFQTTMYQNQLYIEVFCRSNQHLVVCRSRQLVYTITEPNKSQLLFSFFLIFV
jgi:hypothetical protein